MSDPDLGQGAAAVRLPDTGSSGSAEGVEQQTEPRGPETEGEPAESGSVLTAVVQHRNAASDTA